MAGSSVGIRAEDLDDFHSDRSSTDSDASARWNRHQACIASLAWREVRAPHEVFRVGRLGQEPVATNAMEALRQDVDEKAANELVRRERYDFVARLTALA
jgi:hypothetical protein